MTKKSDKERLFEVMGRLDKTFKPQLNELEDYHTSTPDGAAGWARAHADTYDEHPDYPGPEYDYDKYGDGVPEDEYVEKPEVETQEFTLYGNVEAPEDYLYTVYERKPNSEFGDVLIQAMKYADDTNPTEIEYRKAHPEFKGNAYKRNNKGVFGHDFNKEDIPNIKKVLNKYGNVKGVSEFMKAMDSIVTEMPAYEEYLEKAKEGPYYNK